eukprot:3169432-Amphidinium_carterae.2
MNNIVCQLGEDDTLARGDSSQAQHELSRGLCKAGHDGFARQTRERVVWRMAHAIGVGEDSSTGHCRTRPKVTHSGQHHQASLKQRVVGIWRAKTALKDRAQIPLKQVHM